MPYPSKPPANVHHSNPLIFGFLHRLNALLHRFTDSIASTGHTSGTANTGFDRWLQGLPSENEFKFISNPRRFAHDETKYDEQYKINPTDMRAGQGLVNLLHSYQADFSGPGLEIGCGTGRLSMGIVAKKVFPMIILSDPSPAFLEITRRKLQQIGADIGNIHLAVLMAEEIDRLPPNTFALIVLRL